MTWHAQETSYTLRQFDDGFSYEQRSPYRSVATVFVLGEGVVFIHSFLNADQSEITPGQWRELRRYLRDVKKVRKVLAERHGFDKDYDTGPAPLS